MMEWLGLHRSAFGMCSVFVQEGTGWAATAHGYGIYHLEGRRLFGRKGSWFSRGTGNAYGLTPMGGYGFSREFSYQHGWGRSVFKAG